MCKSDMQSRRSGLEKSGMDTFYFDEGQLLDNRNDDIGEKETSEDVDSEGIHVAT